MKPESQNGRGLHINAPLMSSRMKIHVDAQCQASTSELAKYSHIGRKMSTTNIFFLGIAVYLVTCVMFAHSQSLQSHLVYLHSMRWPLGNLKDMTRFRIAEGRSLTISMAGTDTLEGYHLLPAGQAAVAAASLSGIERDRYFDDQIRNAATIVVYLHGNAATRAHQRRIDMIKQIAAFCNSHVLSFDYRYEYR